MEVFVSNLKHADLDPNKPLVIPVLWMKWQVVTEFAPLFEIVENGWDRDLLLHETTGAGMAAKDNRTEAATEFYDHAARSIRGYGDIDCNEKGWTKRVPVWVKVAAVSKMRNAMAIDDPILEEDEKNV